VTPMSTSSIQLRYGCNPNQTPARAYVDGGPLPLKALNGAPGYINLLDALNAWQLVRELREACALPAAASFKHVSPAGAAIGIPLSGTLARACFADDLELSPIAAAYARARGADIMSSYGDAAAASDVVDASLANLLKREVSDLIIAPGYDEEALAILKQKKGGKYLVLQVDPDYEPPQMEARQVFGITLEQRRNDVRIDRGILQNVVTERKEVPPDAERDLLVATVALKYTQSNSVCFAYDGQVIGLGAGQQSRVHCTRLAGTKADLWFLRQHPRCLDLPFRPDLGRPARNNAVDKFLSDEVTPAEERVWREAFTEVPTKLTAREKRDWLDRLDGVSLSSDAYIPFRDNIDRAARSGVKYVVQTGGSLRDDEVIAAADEYGMVMAFSRVRLFHH
jgi:phosphoribosylaminoimidazolecarboxamide formyltransferase/IMP cyclohydrolase